METNFNMKSYTINFSLDEGGKNFGKNNGLRDYACIDTSLSISNANGQIAEALSLTKADNTDKLISLKWLLDVYDRR